MTIQCNNMCRIVPVSDTDTPLIRSVGATEPHTILASSIFLCC